MNFYYVIKVYFIEVMILTCLLYL